MRSEHLKMVSEDVALPMNKSYSMHTSMLVVLYLQLVTADSPRRNPSQLLALPLSLSPTTHSLHLTTAISHVLLTNTSSESHSLTQNHPSSSRFHRRHRLWRCWLSALSSRLISTLTSADTTEHIQVLASAKATVAPQSSPVGGLFGTTGEECAEQEAYDSCDVLEELLKQVTSTTVAKGELSTVTSLS